MTPTKTKTDAHPLGIGQQAAGPLAKAGEGRWGDICAREVAWMVEAAREGVPRFVEDELEPLSRNLLRSINLSLVVRDLYRITNHIGDTFFGVERPPPLVLASEEHLARAFSRWCLGADSLNLFLAETFAFLQDALVRDKGHSEEEAKERVAEAIAAFAPVRLEALRRLACGPRLVRVFTGPTAYMTVPAVWTAASASLGQRRARAAASERVFANRVKRGLGIEVEPRGSTPTPVKLAFAGLACTVGSAMSATAAYRMLDMKKEYIDLLDEVELLLLEGTWDEDEDPVGPGLLDVIDALEAGEPIPTLADLLEE